MKVSENAGQIIKVLGTEFLEERLKHRQIFQDARTMIEYTDNIIRMALEIPRFFDKSTPEGAANLSLLIDLMKKGDRNGVKQFAARILPYYEEALRQRYYHKPQVKSEHGGLPITGKQ